MDLQEIAAYGNLQFMAKQMVEGFITGLHKSPYHGFSVEFAEHRLYNMGESTRHIDWKVYAKTDKFFTRRYEEETNLRCMILLDVSSSMYYPIESNNKIKFSAVAAASLACMFQKQRDAVGITSFAEKIEKMTPVKSTQTHIHDLFLYLQQILDEKQKQKSAISQVIHQIAEQIHKRSLVIIFSDMMENVEDQEALFSALQHLKYRNHEVILFHVADKKLEVDFSFQEKPYVFVDKETGVQEKIWPSKIKESYRQKISYQHQNIKLRCGQYKVDFIPVDANKGVKQVLVPYLIKRKKMS